MNSKIIAIVSAHYLPHLGGVERYVHNLAKQLSDRGYRVVIITSRLTGMTETEVDQGIEIYRLPCYELMNGRLPLVKKNKRFRELVEELNEIDFDTIVINTRFYLLSAWGVWYGRKRRIPMMLVEHGTAHMDLNQPILNFIGEAYEHALTYYIKGKCNEYYGVSQQCIEWLRHFNIPAKGVLYNAINQEDYVESNSKFRMQKGIPNDAIVISFVGRIIKEKGILKLIQAFQKIMIEYDNVFLVIAGDGDLLDRICECQNSRLMVLGKISHKQVISLLHETDIYCLPTDYPEGFPTAVLEAAMCECCVVATEKGGTKELITDESVGCILHNNDVEEIIAVLSNLAENRVVIKEKASKIKELVISKYTWAKTADEYERIMRD